MMMIIILLIISISNIFAHNDDNYADFSPIKKNNSINAKIVGTLRSTKILSKSLLNTGNHFLGNSYEFKLKNSLCLNIVVIGGSVTCGMTYKSSHPDRPNGKQDAWPASLGNILNANLECKSENGNNANNQHQIHNLCVGAVATDYWVDKVSNSMHSQNSENALMFSYIKTADIIIVETSINDVAELVWST